MSHSSVSSVGGAFTRLFALTLIALQLGAAPSIESPESARAVALQFLSGIDASPKDDRAVAERVAPDDPLGCGDCWRVLYPTGERLQVSAEDGEILDFFSPLVSQAANTIPPKRPISRAEALAEANRVLLASGGSEAFQLFDARLQTPGSDPQVGHWVIELFRTWQGIPFETDYARVMLEANSGAVIGLHKTIRTPLPASLAVVLTQSEAESRAANALSQFGRPAGNPSEAVVKIVQPNIVLGGTADPNTARVAWAVKFVGMTVFVDAASGEILGGRAWMEKSPSQATQGGSVGSSNRAGDQGLRAGAAVVPPVWAAPSAAMATWKVALLWMLLAGVLGIAAVFMIYKRKRIQGSP